MMGRFFIDDLNDKSVIDFDVYEVGDYDGEDRLYIEMIKGEECIGGCISKNETEQLIEYLQKKVKDFQVKKK
jgi:hypothetical protein